MHSRTGKTWRYIGCAILCAVLFVGAYLVSGLIARLRTDSDLGAHRRGLAQYGEERQHYRSLSAPEQYLYAAIDAAISKGAALTETVMLVPTEQQLEAAVCALIADDPLCIGVDWQKTEVISGEYTAQLRLFYDEDRIGQREQLLLAAQQIANGCDAQDVYARAVYLHDALTVRTAYPTEQQGELCDHSAYGALVDGISGGFGYASAYKLLCDLSGIPCSVVYGSVNGAPHAWNCLSVDGETGYTDVLWDDAEISYETPSGSVGYYGYFFLSGADMALDHTPDNEALWTMGETTDYYEKYGYVIGGDTPLDEGLVQLLAAAGTDGDSVVSFKLTGSDVEEDTLHDAIEEALDTVRGASAYADGKRLAAGFRVCRVSAVRNAYTVYLFYEDDLEGRSDE